jgi:hypothetical protein
MYIRFLDKFRAAIISSEKNHEVGFRESRRIFSQKMGVNIAKNCDHNIDPSW